MYDVMVKLRADVTSAVASCRAFYQAFPYLTRTIFVCMDEHGATFHTETLLFYDAVHDYLVQTHVL